MDINKITVDLSCCETKADFHNKIKDDLKLPGVYGANLDALWDALTGIIALPADVTLNYLPDEKPSDDTILIFKQIVDTFIDASYEEADLKVTVNF